MIGRGRERIQHCVVDVVSPGKSAPNPSSNYSKLL